MKKKFKELSDIKVVVDFSNAVYRSFYATSKDNMVNTDGINVGFILGLVKILNHAIKNCKEEGALPELIICEDRSPTRKRKLYEKYWEALLDYAPDKSWDGEDEKQRIRYKGNRMRDELEYDPLSICKDFMECLPCSRIYCDGEEADDVIASYLAKNKEDRIFVYSTDKDLWQMIPKFPNLTIILGDGTSPTDEVIEKHFQTTDKNKIMLHKVIRGDSGDNVKPIKNFQFKRNLDIYLDCDGTPEDYLRLLIERRGKDDKYTLHFMSFLKVAILNYKVVNLRYDLKYEQKINPTPNRDRWNKLCRVYETPSIFNSPLLKIY